MRKRLNFLQINVKDLDACVANNFKSLCLSYLFFPILLLLLIVVFLFINDAFSFEAYAQMQKELFIYLNDKLSAFPIWQINLTQLGDVAIFLPFLTLFVVYAPKFWESLLTSLLVSSILTNLLKRIFAVPRPAAMFDNTSFVIIGDTLSGNTSLPSGHSIATFTILTSLFFGFMPKKLNQKILWFLFIFTVGLLIVFSRVGVGAHYPIDVIIGSIIGYLSSIIGIFINNKFNMWRWMTNKKYYLITLAILSICWASLINKIVTTHLLIYYFSLASLTISIFIITRIYVKKRV